MPPKVFIGSSTEGLIVAQEVQAELYNDAFVHVWTQNIFNLSNTTLDDLFNAVNSYDLGIFIFTADDVAKIRNKSYQVARDNVVFELGFFISKLGKGNVFYLIPDNHELHIATDLLGVKPGVFKDDPNIRAAVGPFCNEIRKIIKRNFISTSKLGPVKEGFFGDFSDSFKTLFSSSKELTLFFIHARSWRDNHHDLIRKFLSNKERKIQVFLPDFFDKALMENLRSNFDDGSFLYIYIREAYNFFIILSKQFPKNLEIRCCNYYPSYSFYKFDNTAIIAMYATTPKRKNVPAFLIKKDTGFWDFFEDDLAILNENANIVSNDHILEIKNFNFNKDA